MAGVRIQISCSRSEFLYRKPSIRTDRVVRA